MKTKEKEIIYKTKMKWNKVPRVVDRLLNAVGPDRRFGATYDQESINTKIAESNLSEVDILDAIDFIKSKSQHTFTHNAWNYGRDYTHRVANEPNTRYGSARYGSWIPLRGIASTYQSNQFTAKQYIKHAIPLIENCLKNLDNEQQKYLDNQYRIILGDMKTRIEGKENYFAKCSVPTNRDDLAQAFNKYIEHLSKGDKYRNWEDPYDNRWSVLYETHSHYICVDTGDLLHFAEQHFIQNMIETYRSGYYLYKISNPELIRERNELIQRQVKLERMKQGMSQTLKEFFDELKQLTGDMIKQEE